MIERLIGVLKKRWQILREGPEMGFSVAQQGLFVYALAAVHNFALDHGGMVEVDEILRQDIHLGAEEDNEDLESTGVDEARTLADDIMVAFRDRLATSMRREYQNE